eukprot:CAMPEP_0177621368 /NCGR_PEP_ID=MMETSP0419_2-20121207/27546_1 /TAXON_ID=582737 /ORGANISM="Tetraselmis sp., Strain GSL018" /LENGTH=644 /DNA_ID=CAMNT_0019121277 /DNA_START=295 /DNA_END=2232 /DNA_ORIENTATION=+
MRPKPISSSAVQHAEEVPLIGGSRQASAKPEDSPWEAADAVAKQQRPPAPRAHAAAGVATIDDQGKASYVQVEKQTLVQNLGIPYRDLRILDPLVPMPYPTAIFIREKALVINLETIKMIICRDQVFLLSVVDMSMPDKPARPTLEHHFTADLCRRLKSPGPLRRDTNVTIDTDLPYELRALEAALAEANKVLEHEVTNLEQDARSALDNLTKKVSRAALENVRRVKTRLNRLTARIGKLREELEDLMDDDEDMADMYLGRRAEMEKAQEAANQELQQMQSDYNAAMRSPRSEGHPPGEAAGDSDAWEGADAGGDFYEPWHEGAAAEYHEAPAHGEECSEPAELLRRGSAETEPCPGAAGEAEEGGDGSERPMRHSADEYQEAPVAEAGRRASEGTEAREAALPGGAGEQPLRGLLRGRFRRPRGRRAQAQVAQVGVPAAQALQRARTGGEGKAERGPFHPAEGAAHPIIEFRKSKSVSQVGSSAEPEEHQQHDVAFDDPQIFHWSGTSQKAEHWGGVDPHDIEGVEALLEAYFMQVDFSMSRLVILKERIDDTEDLINIELDSRRNELVALEVILTTLTLIFSIISSVGGIFGMNLKSGIEEDEHAFYIVTGLSILVAISAFVAIIIYCRQKRLMFMGVPSKI